MISIDGAAHPGRARRREFAVVAIAASAGGLAAIRDVLAALPGDFPIPIVVVQHLSATFPSRLTEIFARCTGLHVERALEGSPLVAGTVYVATPDTHLTVRRRGAETLRLTGGAKVHFTRPSADTLFHSVAQRFADRAIAVILSGAGSDGAEGARAVERAGGRVIVQDRATSQHFGMPRAAARATAIPLVLPLEGIAPALVALASEGVN